MRRQWKTGDRIEIHLPMRIRVRTGYRNSLSVEWGPLVFCAELEGTLGEAPAEGLDGRLAGFDGFSVELCDREGQPAADHLC